MKNFRYTLALLAAAMTIAGAACSNDDTPGDPEGTVTINMYDEEHGKTLLGYSDIYIDRGQNFIAGYNCELFVMGRTNGLGGLTIRALETGTTSAAVEAGCSYVAVRPGALVSFPSGKLAMPINQTNIDYMRIHVASTLHEEGKAVGAVVRYVTVQPEQYDLPPFGSTVLDIDYSELEFKSDEERKEVTIVLPSAECEYNFNDTYGQFSCTQHGNKLTFTLPSYVEMQEGLFTLWLRYRESCTKVHVAMHW